MECRSIWPSFGLVEYSAGFLPQTNFYRKSGQTTNTKPNFLFISNYRVRFSKEMLSNPFLIFLFNPSTLVSVPFIWAIWGCIVPDSLYIPVYVYYFCNDQIMIRFNLVRTSASGSLFKLSLRFF